MDDDTATEDEDDDAEELNQVCDVCINKPYKNGVAAEFIDTISNKYNEWQSNRDEEDDGIFRVCLSIGATKPLIPSYVGRGIRAIKTPAMKEAIANCFQKDGLLEEARLPATYQRALLVLTDEVDIPDEVEEEEDLGPIEDETVQALEENQFDIEIIQDDCSDTASSDAEEDEEAEEGEEPTHEEKAQEPPKRQRKENTMVGGVRKGNR